MPKFAFQNSNKPAITPLYPEPESQSPVVLFTMDADLTIRHLVREMDIEVAWFGLVRYEEPINAYVVYKILIPEQEVTPTTVDITADAVTRLINEILDAGDDPSHLRYHGHSHVRMPCSPSPTDQEHIADYLEHADWFIREIRNKAHDSKVDVFDKRVNIVFQCVRTEIYESLRPDSFYNELDDLIDERVLEPPRPVPTINKLAAQKRPLPRRPELLDYTDLEDDYLLSDPFFVQGN